MTKRIKPSKSRYASDCLDTRENSKRVKRASCNDPEFYEEWIRWIEESEKVGCAVFCVCTAVDPYYCKCASIVTQ